MSCNVISIFFIIWMNFLQIQYSEQIINNNNNQLEYHQNYSKIYEQTKLSIFQNNHNAIAEQSQPSLVEQKVYETCPKFATGQFVYPYTCNQFLNCWNGRGVLQNCAPGTLFNPKTLTCDHAHNVQCSYTQKKLRPRSLTPTNRMDFTQILCPTNFKGLIPNYTDCSRFLHCTGDPERPAVQYRCASGQHFDYDVNRCERRETANCFAVNTDDAVYDGVGQQTADRGHENRGSNAPRDIRNFNEVKCEPGSVGLFKHPYDCAKFLNCANGMTFVQDCAPGTLFSSELKNCDFPYRVKCENGVNRVDRGGSGYSNSGSVDESGYNTGGENNGGYNQGADSNWGNNNGVRKCVFSYDQNGCSSKQKTTTPTPTSTVNYQSNIDENDYNHENKKNNGQTWPPKFPSYINNNDSNNGYNYYNNHENNYDGQVVRGIDSRQNVNIHKCSNREDFRCDSLTCLRKHLVCDNVKDCDNGLDEINCIGHMSKFQWTQNRLNTEPSFDWFRNLTVGTCAFLCLDNGARCVSFNYRKSDNACFLLATNSPQTIIKTNDFDYFPLITNQNLITNCTHNPKCQVYLTDGANKSEGVIAFNISNAQNQNGYVCHNNVDVAHQNSSSFGLTEANIICHELGYQFGASEVRKVGSYFSDPQQNNFQYVMKNVKCQGNESRLFDCKFSIEKSACQEKVGVVCKTHFDNSPKQIECPKEYWKCLSDDGECLPLSFVCDGLLDCTDGSDELEERCESPVKLRLVNGSTPYEGRLEVRHHGTWGTVCDDDFNDDAAKVVCKQLGFYNTRKSIVHKDGYYGAGEGIIWLDQVFCAGNESSIELCTHWNWGEHNCEHGEDVGVACIPYHEGEDVGGGREQTLPPREGRGGVEQKRPDDRSTISQIPEVESERHLKHHHENGGKRVNNLNGGTTLSNGLNGDYDEDGSLKRFTSPLPQKCGLRKDASMFESELDGSVNLVQARVIGGSVAKRGDYPWQAAIRVKSLSPKKSNDAHWCGAIIIAQKWLLTAAHCLVGYAKGAYVIVAGDYDIDDDLEHTEQYAHIEDFYIHENFRKNGHRMNNDIALIRLKNNGLTLNSDVRPICLPPEDGGVSAASLHEIGANCTISGYGSVSSGKSGFSHVLRAGWIPIQSDDVCKMPHVYGTNGITDVMFCAGSLEGGVDACDGDSGGPLACLDNGVFTLYGIVSWGQHCGYANKPGVYVKVSKFRKWIEETMNKYS